MEEFPRHGADVYELQKCIVSLIIGVGTEAGNWLARQMATNDEVLKISIFKAYDIWQVDSTWKTLQIKKNFGFWIFNFLGMYQRLILRHARDKIWCGLISFWMKTAIHLLSNVGFGFGLLTSFLSSMWSKLTFWHACR